MSKLIDILLLSGEKSGDQLACQLINDINQHIPGLHIAGMGGDDLKEAGMDVLVDNKNLSIIGLWEVFKKLPIIWRAWKKLKVAVKQSSPLVILIDYPGMNLRFAKLAKKNGCRVLYYVSPQIWAWKAGRLKTIQRCVDHMAVLFPFEKSIYDKAGVPCTVVGHPLTKNMRACEYADKEGKKQLDFDTEKPLVVLCPGSRSSEITRLLPVLIESGQKIKEQLPETQFALLCASTVSAEQLAIVPSHIRILPNEQLDSVFRSADAGIVVSGTITLEAACRQLPMAIIYKMSPANFWLAKRLVKIPHIGLCNIVCQKELAKEFIQKDARPELIAKHIIGLVQNKNSRQEMSAIFTALPPASHAQLIPVVKELL
jgi:lipid-A-disaccharide synthase